MATIFVNLNFYVLIASPCKQKKKSINILRFQHRPKQSDRNILCGRGEKNGRGEMTSAAGRTGFKYFGLLQ